MERERERKSGTATQSRTGVSASGGPCAIHYTMAAEERKKKGKGKREAHPCEELNLGFPMESRASLPLDDMGHEKRKKSPPSDTRMKKEKERR